MTTLLSPKLESTLPAQPVASPASQDQVDSATTYSALAPQDWPNIDHLVTEDDTPVDNIFSEKQQRLLVESLYTSWRGTDQTRQFLALANVGLFCGINQPPLVPDALLSLEVKLFEDIWTKAHRSYLLWEYGKPPEVVIEIVSNQKGHELDSKLHDYARIGVAYYIVYDPKKHLGEKLLYLYERRHISYVEISGPWLPEIELGLTLWHGQYEDREDTWLRWCDQQGNLILTGAERAEQERQRAEQEYQRAEQEHQRADQESQRADQESQRADQESQRADQESQRADQESQRAEQANQDKDQALFQLEQERQRVAQLLAQLQALESNNK